MSDVFDRLMSARVRNVQRLIDQRMREHSLFRVALECIASDPGTPARVRAIAELALEEAVS